MQNEFKKELNLWDATMLVIGSMIGSGIFIVTADIARNVGSPFYVLLVWLISGFITLTAALSYGELAGMMPKAGGQYVYLCTAYNRLVGFLFGWTTFAVVQTGVIAAVAIAFARFMGLLVPFFSETNTVLAIGSYTISTQQVLAIALIALLTYTNSRGVREAKWIQSIFTASKVIALLGLMGLYVAFVKGQNVLSWDTFFALPKALTKNADGSITTTLLGGFGLLVAIGLASVGSLFSSDAWNNITFTAGELKNPKKDIPLSLFFGTLTVTFLYVMANVAYLLLLPIQGDPAATGALQNGIAFAANDRVGAAAAEMILGQTAVVVMALLIIISTFGCNNGLILSGARLTYAMAQDKLFFPKAKNLNSNGVPAFALWIQAAWAGLLCLSGGYGTLLDFCTFASLCFYIITVLGVFILRKTMPDVERPYKAFGYPVFPALYILIAGAIALDLLIFKPYTSWAGVGIVAVGIPIYYFITKKAEN